MVMSQGTSTFLTCFAGFWLVWALVVLLCCFCSVLQRGLKQRRRTRPAEQRLHLQHSNNSETCLARTTMSLVATPPGIHLDHCSTEAEVLGEPPCYEDAVLMEDLPPPYSDVLSNTTGSTSSEQWHSVGSKPERSRVLCEREKPSSLIHLPKAQHCGSLGFLLSSAELKDSHVHLPVSALQGHTCELPTIISVLGRSTAV